MALPQFNTKDRILAMLQSQWASSIDPVITNPLVQGQLLPNITVATGSNTIDHKLSRKLQGYMVVMQSAPATFYDTQATNPMPAQTLQLVSSGPAVISLWVF